MSEPRLDGQTFAGSSSVIRYANLVKLPHTVFALPFAVVGVVYASFEDVVTLRVAFLVVVAFTTARFAAMAFNRIVDRRYDALNPRTRRRELPVGTVSLTGAWMGVLVAGAMFVVAALLLNPLCFALSPVALVWILSYSYAKRFTAWSHAWLGAGLGIAPVGGYLAVTGTWAEPWWTLPAIAIAVLTWVAGFDMFYALSDEDFDRSYGLKSAVVALGRERSILTAKLLHGVTIVLLVLFAIATPFSVWYYVGVAAAAAILAYEHRLVKANDLSRLDAAFFRMNGVMSIVVALFAIVDRAI